MTATEEIQLDTTQSGPIVELDAAVTITRVHAGDTDLPTAIDTNAHTLHVDLTSLTTQPATFTVEYTAVAPVGASSQQQTASLIATQSRDDDPVTARVVYTDSEPNRALYWLVTKLDPSDRALWSAQLTVDPDEDVISNGARMSDTMAAGKRVVAYALDKPIPAYLMAFAAGQLEHTDRTVGTLPMSVWYRHGLVLDPGATLDALATAKGVFETEIMPYPWDSYTVVLLPYGGGMENATITFDDEEAGQGNVDLSLQAHEFSHHWFGDWVTMNTYDDVWFKEGMATVLQSEADQANRDAQHLGRNWGIDFGFNTGESIVDPSLHGLDKYGSGPYQRAAWLISQIRATVGEQAFFDGLRTVLHTYALGSVTGEEFIGAFDLTADQRAQAIAILPKKGAPSLQTDIAGDDLTFHLTDPDSLMLAPLTVTTVDASGGATTTTLDTGAATAVTVPAGGYLAVDERDVHPFNTFDFMQSNDEYVDMMELGLPTGAALTPFLARSAAQQERVLGQPVTAAPLFGAYVAGLDSTVAKLEAIENACPLSTTDPAWATALLPLLDTPPLPQFDPSLARCGGPTALAHFEGEIQAAMTDGSPAALARAEYLLSFDYGSDSLAVVGSILTGAPTLRLRDRALWHLYYQTSGFYGYAGVPVAQQPAWNTLIEGELTSNISTNRMDYVINIISNLGDVGALPKLGMSLHSAALADYEATYAVCYAWELASRNTASSAWEGFVAAIGTTSDLPAAVQAVITTPSSCAQLGFRRAPLSAGLAAPGKHGDLARHR